MKALTQFTFAALLALLTFASCKKEQAEPQAKFDQAEANREVQELIEEMDLASQAIQSAQAQYKVENPECLEYLNFPECANVSIEPLGRGMDGTVMTVDFNDGCLHNGQLKMGTIEITIVGYPEDADFQMTTEYIDYTFKNKVFNGTRSISNLAGLGGGAGLPKQDEENQVFLEEVDITQTSQKNGLEVISTTSGEFQIEWLSGINNDECHQNIFSYEGSRVRTVEVSNGNSWTVTLDFDEPGVYDEACGHFVEGEMEVYKSRNKTSYYYDFGDGECDAIAERTVNGVTTEVALAPVNL